MPATLRFAPLVLGGSLPLLARAQFTKEYAAGSYVLHSDSTRRLTGRLRLKKQQKLLVVSPTGRRLRLTPTQVSSFRMGSHDYAVIGDFLVKNKDVRAAFAERLDSGRVTLFHYTHLWNSGADWLYLHHYTLSFYLVGGISEHLIDLHDYADPTTFRRQAGRVLARRPDLLQLLQKGRITYANFPAAVHALNSGKPLMP